MLCCNKLCYVVCCDVLCCARNPLPPLSTVPAQPDEPPPTHPTSKTDPISSSEVAWVRHQDSVPTCLQSHMSPPIGLSRRDGVGWGGVGWGGAGHVPSLKGLQALVGFQTLGSGPQPTSTPQGCGDNGTSLILGGTRGGGGSLTRGGGGVRKGVGVGGGGLGVMVQKSLKSEV